MKAGTADMVDEGAIHEVEASGSTVVGTPNSEDAASQEDESTTEAAEASSTSTRAQSKGKGNAAHSLGEAKANRTEQSAHLMGKINNLVTSDLQSLDDLGLLAIFWSTFSFDVFH